MDFLPPSPPVRVKVPYLVLTYIAWKNLGRSHRNVAVYYEFIYMHFPGILRFKNKVGTDRNIRGPMQTYFNSVFLPGSDVKSWTVKEDKLEYLESQLGFCMQNYAERDIILQTMPNPDIIGLLVEGRWGAFAPDRRTRIHETKLDIVSAKAQQTQKSKRGKKRTNSLPNASAYPVVDPNNFPQPSPIQLSNYYQFANPGYSYQTYLSQPYQAISFPLFDGQHLIPYEQAAVTMQLSQPTSPAIQVEDFGMPAPPIDQDASAK